jgi:hypothetical protein
MPPVLIIIFASISCASSKVFAIAVRMALSTYASAASSGLLGILRMSAL